MQIEFLIAVIILAYGLSLILRGKKSNSKPRLMSGLAVIFVGASLFARSIYWLQMALLLVGVSLFVSSMRMLRDAWREMQELDKQNREQR